MDRRPWVVRLQLEVIYLAVTFAVLRYCYAGAEFCHPGTSADITGYVFRLSCLIVFFDGLAGICAWACSKGAEEGALRFIPMVFAAVLMAGVMFGLPNWMNSGYRVLRLANVDCLFAEGYGMMFLFLGPLFFGLLTLAREVAVLKLARPAANGEGISSIE